MLQFLHKSSTRSPESELFSDWSQNKKIFKPAFLIGYMIGCLTFFQFQTQSLAAAER